MSDSQPKSEASTWDDSRITAYVMGELDPKDRDVFEDELAGDTKLQAAVDQAREVTAQLQGLYGDEPTVVLDAQRRDAILSSNEEAAVTLGDPSGETGNRHKIAWVLAAAAAILLAIGLVPKLNDRTTVLVAPDGIQDNQDDGAIEVEEAVDAESIEMTLEGPQQNHPISPEGDDEGAEGDATVATMPESSNSGLSAATGLGRGRDQDRQAGVAPLALNSAESSPELAVPPVAPPASSSLAEGTTVVDDGRIIIYNNRADRSALGDATAARGGAHNSRSAARGGSDDGLESGDQDVANHPFKLGAEDGALMSGEMAPTSNPVPDEPMAPESNRMMGGMGGGYSMKSDPTGDANVEYVPELGQVIVKGSTRDVHRVQEAIKNRVSRGWEAERSRAKAEAKRLQDRLRLLEQSPADGDRFEPIIENEFKSVSEHPLSTFSIDVDTASYSKVRQILNAGSLPSPDAVRAEELINYFDYQYESPAADAEHPFAADVTITNCPWTPEHRLARVGIQGKRLQPEQRPACNLVFLLDTSGSMNAPNKLPLVIDGMKMLAKQLGENDRVAIVVYAGSAGLVLESTPAVKKKKIRRALNQLSAGGSTNGEAGIQLAYTTARDNFIDGGVNRVILCTDGDFNVGTQNTGDLVRLIKEEASGGIFLTALGFGMGNHNDAMMKQISGEGNGNYAFIDTANEAKKVLVRQTDATLVTIAKDVKLQLEFNPRLVSAYRLIGYENRVMAKEDFNDDQKDAGEIGAGHQVTAFYELVPGDTAASPATESDAIAESVPTEPESAGVDPLKYQTSRQLSDAASSNESMTIKLRYKQPESDTSTKVEFKAIDEELKFDAADDDFQFAAAVASFAMQLRNSKFVGNWTLENVAETVAAHQGDDEFGLRREFESLVGKAARFKVAE